MEHLLAYLKHESVGSRCDCIKVVEYRRGGSPQAHIVLAIENPLGTAQEVNNIVPGELPAEASTWCVVHSCNYQCQFQDFAQDLSSCHGCICQARHVRIAGVRYAMRGLTRIAGWRRLMQQTAGATSSSSSSTFAALGAAGGVAVAAADMLIADFVVAGCAVVVAAHGECSALCWCAHTVLCNHPVNSSIRICSSTVQIFP